LPTLIEEVRLLPLDVRPLLDLYFGGVGVVKFSLVEGEVEEEEEEEEEESCCVKENPRSFSRDDRGRRKFEVSAVGRGGRGRE